MTSQESADYIQEKCLELMAEKWAKEANKFFGEDIEEAKAEFIREFRKQRRIEVENNLHRG